MILISACLLGVPCRHDGAALAPAELPAEFSGRALLPVCPEELGGLATPRPPAELVGGDGGAVLAGAARALRADGADVTAEFLRGAEAAVELARRHGIRLACLKSKSPSCGASCTHLAGSAPPCVAGFAEQGRVAPGMGVAAAALSRAGLRLLEAG